MKAAVLVNRVEEIDTSAATADLIAVGIRRGHEIHVVEVGDLFHAPKSGVTAKSRLAGPDLAESGPADLCRQLTEAPAATHSLEECDLVLLRTNPARDSRHWARSTSLSFAGILRDRGVRVLNDPAGLQKASSKLYMAYLPDELVPRTLISRNRQEIVAFLDALEGPAILKPLQGTHGRDVFRFGHEERSNLNQVLEVLLRQGWLVAQEYLPEARDGDVRMLVVDGGLLEVEGHAAVVRRIPGAGDFRSNVHAGGRPAPTAVTEPMRRIAAAVGPRLKKDGIFLAGLDVIGDKVIEVNVFSPGGLPHLRRFTGVSFTDAVWRRLETGEGTEPSGRE